MNEKPKDRPLTPEEAEKLRKRATKVKRRHLRVERTVTATLKPR